MLASVADQSSAAYDALVFLCAEQQEQVKHVSNSLSHSQLKWGMVGTKLF